MRQVRLQVSLAVFNGDCYKFKRYEGRTACAFVAAVIRFQFGAPPISGK